MGKQKLVNWLIFILLALIWGSSFILMKRSAEYLTGWQIGALRIFSAGLVFIPFGLFHLAQLPRRMLPLIFLSGLLGNLFPAFLFAIAIEKVDSSLGGILNSLTPLFVIVIGILFFRQRTEPKKLAGVMVGFAGLVILSLSKGGGSFENIGYILLILLATIFYGLNVNLVSLYLKDLPPLKMATVSLTLLALPAGIICWQQNVFSIAMHDREALPAIAAAALLGIVGSAIATALFYVLISRAGGLFASLVTYAIPIVSIFWGFLDGELITWIQIACLGLILGGVYLANRK